MVSIAGLKSRMRKAQRQIRKWTTQPIFDNTLGLRVNLAYAAYARECRFIEQPSVLADRGFQVVQDILSPDKAAEISEKFSHAIDRGAETYLPPSWAGSFLILKKPAEILDPSFFDSILQGQLDAAITAFFGGHYRIQCIDAMRTYPYAHPPHGSYRWHSDNHPRECVKLMLYLTETGDVGGGTEFIDKVATRTFVANGYDGAVTKERLVDLSRFAEERGLKFEPSRFKLKSGDGVLFQGNNLHKGILPTEKFRDVLSIFFLPSQVPWREALVEAGLEEIQENAFLEQSERWMIWLEKIRKGKNRNVR